MQRCLSGDWMKKFIATSTRPDDFYVSTTETMKVPLMYVNEKFYYGVNNDINCQVSCCVFGTDFVCC